MPVGILRRGNHEALPLGDVHKGIQRELGFIDSLGVGKKVKRAGLPNGGPLCGAETMVSPDEVQICAFTIRCSTVHLGVCPTHTCTQEPHRTEVIRFTMVVALLERADLVCTDVSVLCLHTSMYGADKPYGEMPDDIKGDGGTDLCTFQILIYGLRQASRRFQE